MAVTRQDLLVTRLLELITTVIDDHVTIEAGSMKCQLKFKSVMSWLLLCIMYWKNCFFFNVLTIMAVTKKWQIVVTFPTNSDNEDPDDKVKNYKNEIQIFAWVLSCQYI